MSPHASQARSVYRRLLRELPARTPSLLANPSPMQKHIRADFSASTDSASLQHQATKPVERRLEEAEEYVKYLAGQRMYTTLIERYNPGMNMTEEDRVRLTARRVGMDLPIEVLNQMGKGRK
ncbi:putative ras guanyl-nucleotide exchange factor protein [Zymoseptoria brevis]|uniref:Putative ras guanyl-nucleotide exchange factor protein n=1 Tax=Zymoseptoria brevis TaxID=1047168 RepID=A0A0F4GDR7_9PEZI|nr:putative ras guanyl-nucleotide exchange factor protein [Zymoseptoria brevis]